MSAPSVMSAELGGRAGRPFTMASRASEVHTGPVTVALDDCATGELSGGQGERRNWGPMALHVPSSRALG